MPPNCAPGESARELLRAADQKRALRPKVTTTEIGYAITNLSHDQADAEQLLVWQRGHWGIENRVHYVQAATLDDVARRIRQDTAPQNLAALRDAIASKLRLEGQANIAATPRVCTWKNQRMLTILDILKNQ